MKQLTAIALSGGIDSLVAAYLLKKAGFYEERIYRYYPRTWLPLSIAQWNMRKQKKMNVSVPKWLIIACYPFGWIMSKVGLAEELVGVCIKN